MWCKKTNFEGQSKRQYHADMTDFDLGQYVVSGNFGVVLVLTMPFGPWSESLGVLYQIWNDFSDIANSTFDYGIELHKLSDNLESVSVLVSLHFSENVSRNTKDTWWVATKGFKIIQQHQTRNSGCT